MAGGCAQCEAHAKVHKNALGLANEPDCPGCEAHLKLHGNEGCAGALMIAFVSTAVAALFGGRILRR